MTTYNLISRWSGALGVCAIVAIIRPAHADPRAVVELFTSQGCSSCPPADKILGELAKDPSVIALSMPIDYWDYLGWKDTLADARFSARQKAYSHVRGDREVYTPQAVINGSVHVIGSDRAGIESAINATRKTDDIVMSVPVTMTQSGHEINVSVAASSKGPDGDARRSLDLLDLEGGADLDRARREWRSPDHLPQRGTQPAQGRRLERNSGNWTVPLENISREGVDGAVVYVQDGSRTSPARCWGRPSPAALSFPLPAVPAFGLFRARRQIAQGRPDTPK